MDLGLISTLGRDVRVGNLYNYCDATILPGVIEIASENIKLSDIFNPPVYNQTISIDVSEEARLSCIGINQHLRRLMRAQNLKINRLWFYSYMKDEAFDDRNDNEVYITAYLNFTRKIESLSKKFVDLNIAKYCANKYGGTHLVQGVEYGAEFVLWMHKPIDPSNKETKQTVEQTLRLDLGTYLYEFFEPHQDPPVFDDVLNSMSCSFASSIHNGDTMGNGTLGQCLQMIKELINMGKNGTQNIWRPTEMGLCQIPTLVDIEIANDLHANTVFELDIMQQWANAKSQQLIESPFLRQVTPFLKTSLSDFQKLLDPIAFVINEVMEEVQNKYFSPERYSSFTGPYVSLLHDALRWLTEYRRFMAKVDFVLKGSSLPVLDLRSIRESGEGDNDIITVKAFVLHFECVGTALEERFRKWVILPDRNRSPFLVECLSYFFREDVCKKWQVFLNEATHSVGNDVHYIVGILSPESPHREGSVLTLSYERSSLPLCLPKPSIAIDEPRNALPVVTQPVQSPIAVDQPGISSVSAANTPKSRLAVKWMSSDMLLSNTPHSSSAVGSTGQDCVVDDSSKCQSSALTETTDVEDNDATVLFITEPTETECVADGTTRICEEFALMDEKLCQLLKAGQPNIFLLNAHQMPTISDEFRWFEIGTPSQEKCYPVDHKVILLMGATGCGKSTLINTMVNYFLGVRWADLYRFKIVREEEKSSQNQVYIKTRSVTAYTIHHKPGMAVPYSITIIDTPGYDDFNGTKRDKEITSAIHRFLIEQRDQVLKIHAACFVANYQQNRLTKSQRYVIDSMLSFFGADVKEKIQLLVTSAENYDPPVVRAYLAANFPASLHSEISHYKFNSWLLLDDNLSPEFEDGVCIQEYFCELDRKNFEKFFEKLKLMDGHIVKPIRQVVKSCDVVKQPIKLVEEMAIKKECADGMFAYNCQVCKRTCEKPVFISKAKIAKDSGRQCEALMCKCKGADHSYQNYVWIYKRVVAPIPS